MFGQAGDVLAGLGLDFGLGFGVLRRRRPA